MPKPTYNISPSIITELKKEVLKMASFPIRTKSDAGYLALLMKRNGIDSISESTILRFFNETSNNHKFYLNTLDKFAVFSGKKDFDDFEKWAKNHKEFNFSFGEIPITEKPIKSLIKICIHQNSLKPIHEYTEQLTNLDVDALLRLGFEFYISLLSNKNSNIKFFKEFSGVPIVRESFFEKCTDPDFKISEYAKGYEYYLKYTNPQLGLKQLQDFIFGNCILIRHYFINKNYYSAIKIGEQLYEHYRLNDAELNNVFIYPKMRYMAYKIYYYKLLNRKSDLLDYVVFIIDYCRKNIDSWDYNEQRIAFSCVAEAFIYAKINERHCTTLKYVFNQLLTGYANDFLEHSLNYALKYTDMNGIRTYKIMAKI